ncbi:hypothetical protein [Kangiella sp.]|uniref:hypothetical protein n=1 Tax=Kangiella sp. TaxID=1920245 RepID=UPI00198DD3D5|nr:hypothetical protein [Kangiella sp.]MBD3653408.1 hypothetical protein [Kangiella sp.]
MSNQPKQRISKVTFSFIYWFAAILITLSFTPLLADIFSKDVTAFEGTKGYVYAGLIVSFGLLFSVTFIVAYVVWLIRRLSNERRERSEQD